MCGKRRFGSALHSLDSTEGEISESGGCHGPEPMRTLLPDNHVFRRDILGLTVGSLAIDVGGVQRSRYLDDQAGSGELRVEVGLDGNDIRDCSCPNLIHGGQHFDGEFHV